ncbi:MAG TPA: hypothetical protein VG206_06665 [Terriglobia bacterium]|nr:hypothetical protein [Terriglobia bacterium]
MQEGEPYFELVVVAELIEQEFADLRQSLDLRKQVIDHCRDFPMPPQDVVDQLRVSGDEILRKLGEINRLVRGREATFTPPPAAIVPSRRSRSASQS